MMKTEVSKQDAIKYLERKSFPGWSKRLDWDNLQPSCKACNDTKAIHERKYNN